MSRATCSPSSPVHAFAQPLLTMTPRTTPPDNCRCSRETMTGAACARLVVNTPAAVADVSETRIARSRPLALMPALTPAARNPRAAVTPPAIAQAAMLRCHGLRRLIDCSIGIVYVLESDDRNDHRNLTAPAKERTLDAVRIDLLGEPTVRHHREPDVDEIAWLVRERAKLFISFVLRASAQ